ncbi:MAG: hypothetical protein AAB583_05070 [Patescibacteria group bacterium]
MPTDKSQSLSLVPQLISLFFSEILKLMDNTNQEVASPPQQFFNKQTSIPNSKYAKLFIILLILLLTIGISAYFLQSRTSPITNVSQTEPPTSTASLTPTILPSPRSTITPTPRTKKLNIEQLKTYIKEAKNIGEVKSHLQQFLNEYDMTVQIDNFKHPSYAEISPLDALDLGKLTTYSLLFINEWKKYPADYVKNSRIAGIVLGKNLRVSGTSRAAMPDSESKLLYLDIIDSSNTNYVQGVIHHEYYHLIEYNYFGSFYYKDPVWSSFNDPTFKYYGSGADAYADSNYTEKEHPVKGFASFYALYALEEDKAETYSYIMRSNFYKKLLEWIKTDEILAKKVNYLKQFMKDHSLEIDEDYFTKISL